MRTIPPSLLEKINKRHQTIYENADPKLKVLLSKGFSKELFRVYTIHELDNIAEIDATAKRSTAESEPDKIYIAYIEDGVAHVKSRPLPYDTFDEWTYEFELGAATNVAIDFDGYWERPLGETRFNLVADEFPWIFSLDSGVLKGQYWQNTAVELSTNVSKIRSVKGWVPANGDETNDQGLIIYYLKTDGNVYYRNYAIQSNGSKAWEIERQITEFTGTVVDIALFRTNDFRVGFIAQNNDNTIEYVLTERNWAGMSFEPEIFDNPPSVTNFNITQNDHWTDVLDEQPAEIFDNPPSVSNFGMNICTVEELDEVIEIVNYEFEFGGNTIAFEFSRNIDFTVSQSDFITNGISSVFTVTDTTILNNLLTVTIAETLPYTGFTITINSGQLTAVMSAYCTRTLGEFIYEDGGLPEQEETFNNPPSISSFNISQNVHSTITHDEQPVETFNNPPSVSNFSITILDVNGDPL
jgi:hypothetical protein